MAVLFTDISVVLSGGSGNSDPQQSLGGDPSATPLIGFLNNLFDDFSPSETLNGYTDYRCFYVFNDNDADILYDAKVWIDSQVSGGGQLSLGVPLVSEVQTINITGDIDGGYAEFRYDSTHTVEILGTPSFISKHAYLQAQLRTIPQCSGVVVTGTYTSGNTLLTITFAAGRNHPTLTLIDNSLTGTGSIDVTIVKLTDGGPINTIASPIDTGGTTPSGITFTNPTLASQIMLGNLYPLDGLPIWVKRVVAPNTAAVVDDGAILKFSGKPFP